MRWHERDAARWQAEQEIAHQVMEDVESFIDEGGKAHIQFRFPLRSLTSQHEYGVFRLLLIYPHDFPRNGRFPSVHLLSHRDRWQMGPDSHIESDWRLCLFVPIESGIDFTRADSLRALLGKLWTFLRLEMMYQRDLAIWLAVGGPPLPLPKWPGPDRAHGDDGLMEVLQERGGLNPKDPCLCGTGLRFGNCCMPRLRRIAVKSKLSTVL